MQFRDEKLQSVNRFGSVDCRSPRVALYVRRSHRRSARGSIFPFVAVAMLMLVAYVGFSTDVMRNFLAIRKLQFASDAAALAGYSSSVGKDGNFNRQNIQATVLSAGANPGSAWNMAPSGPPDLFTGPWNSGVTFSDADITFVQNPADASESFLQVTAKRTGNDALNQYFMPCLHAMNAWAGAPVPSDMYQKETYRLTEVVGQPASRIGAGAPIGSTAAATMNYSCCCPIALSNIDFQAASAANGTFSLDFSKLSTPSSGNKIRASFVNLTRGGGSLKYYSDASNANLDQLIALLKYFAIEPASVPPAAVERGSSVAVFDPTTAKFKQQQTQIVAILQKIAASSSPYLVCPVIQNPGAQATPDFTGLNKVQGFARVKIISPQIANGAITCNIVVNSAESLCVNNSSFANDFATIPFANGTLLPPPIKPFTARIYSPADNSLSVRPGGIALAPAISPRSVTPQIIAPTFN